MLVAHESSTLAGPVVLTRRKLNHSDLVAHAPPRDHLASQPRCLFDVVLRACGATAIDDLLCRAPAQHAYDLRAQIGFGVFITIRQRPLICHPRSEEHTSELQSLMRIS